ncbi:HIT family protein [Rhodococcus sp. NPDC127528]|uniref:HIT family protein n=1 Tax=unclassified Rhodococcus (in: high G+C Gram-positive bacteria) TaxID=192944 RepID=UPI003629AE3C
MSTDCAFCDVVADPTATDVVFEDADTLAFLDRRPVFKGHTLLVPRRHIPTLADLPPDLIAPVFAAAQQLSAAVVTALRAEGSFVAMNNVVSQSVPHLHVHIVPRTEGDGLRGFFWPRTRYADSAESADCAARIRSALG